MITLKITLLMKQTAYIKWLLQITRGDVDCLALQLAHDCCMHNAQALDVVAATGDTAYKRGTFYKAAKLIIANNEQSEQKRVPASC